MGIYNYMKNSSSMFSNTLKIMDIIILSYFLPIRIVNGVPHPFFGNISLF